MNFLKSAIIAAIAVLATVPILPVPAASAQEGVVLANVINWKIGVSRFAGSITYDFETRRRGDSTATVADEKVSRSNSGGFQTTDIFIEYIIEGRFGLELRGSLAKGNRAFTLKDTDGVQIGDVDQIVNNQALYGASYYFLENSNDGGFNAFLGLMTGTIVVQNEFKDGNLGADGLDDSLQNYNSSQKSELSLPVQIIRLGADLNSDSVGMRLEIHSITGEQRSSAGLGTTPNDSKQKEMVSVQGGVSFAVFAVF